MVILRPHSHPSHPFSKHRTGIGCGFGERLHGGEVARGEVAGSGRGCGCGEVCGEVRGCHSQPRYLAQLQIFLDCRVTVLHRTCESCLSVAILAQGQTLGSHSVYCSLKPWQIMRGSQPAPRSMKSSTSKRQNMMQIGENSLSNTHRCVNGV